jgi:predicted nucleic acid-binding Zn ribbon protein
MTDTSKSRAEKLAVAILADNERIAAKTSDKRDDPLAECFSCGRGITYRGSRFCSQRCREWYDAGNPSFSEQEQQKRKWDTSRPWRLTAGPPGAKMPHMPKAMRRGPVGFYIECANCQKEFESKGLRCCSKECENRYREREGNRAVMAEVGIEVAVKPRCEECGAVIPKWRNGRRVRAGAQFCSPPCSQRAARKRKKAA